MQALLPRGRVWPRDASTVQGQVLDGLAAAYERQTVDATALLVDAFPVTTTQLLPEWEVSLALCTGPAVGLAERRRRVVSKLVDTGGQSGAYYIGLAGSLGFPGCTITEYAAFTAGSGCSDPLNTADTGWPHAWRFNVPVQAGAVSFTATSGCDEALRGWGSAVLECVIRRAAPAHTAVLFGLLDQIGSQPEIVEDWSALA
nr:YmfQ family protein [Azospirillum brasilense]